MIILKTDHCVSSIFEGSISESVKQIHEINKKLLLDLQFSPMHNLVNTTIGVDNFNSAGLLSDGSVQVDYSMGMKGKVAFIWGTNAMTVVSQENNTQEHKGKTFVTNFPYKELEVNRLLELVKSYVLEPKVFIAKDSFTYVTEEISV